MMDANQILAAVQTAAVIGTAAHVWLGWGKTLAAVRATVTEIREHQRAEHERERTVREVEHEARMQAIIDSHPRTTGPIRLTPPGDGS